MVLDPIPQSLPVHFFGSRPQPPTSRDENTHIYMYIHPYEWMYSTQNIYTYVFVHFEYISMYNTYTYLYVHKSKSTDHVYIYLFVQISIRTLLWEAGNVVGTTIMGTQHIHIHCMYNTFIRINKYISIYNIYTYP